MHWKINTKIKDLSDINKFDSLQAWRTVGVVHDDVAKCVPCLSNANSTLNSAKDLLTYIDRKRQLLCTENYISKPFAGNELKYFLEAQ